MKIALISTLLGQKWYGGEISSFLLAENLRKKEDVFVVTSKVTGKMPFRTYSFPLLKYIPNLALLVGHPLIDAYLYPRFLKIFQKEKPDVIHLQDYSLMLPALKAAKKLDIPVVFTVRSYQFMCNLSTCLEHHQLKFNCPKEQYQKCLKSSIKEAYPQLNLFRFFVLNWFYRQNKKIIDNFHKIDFYITVSDFVKEKLIESGIDKNKIKTIKVPKGNWLPQEQKPAPHPIIFSEGGLKKSKGFHFLIKSFRLVADKYPRAVLRIAGDGSARNRLEQLAKNLCLEKNVFLLGKLSHEQMQAEYAQADFAVSPSLWPEPLTRIIFEAFSMKKTIVATDVGGSKELVKQNKTGLLVKRGEEKEMAEAIIRLIGNPKLRDKLALNAYKLINKECDEEGIYEKHLKIYQNLHAFCCKSSQSNHQSKHAA